MTIYAKEVYIALPDKQKKEKDYKPPKITAILCTENNSPAGILLMSAVVLCSAGFLRWRGFV